MFFFFAFSLCGDVDGILKKVFYDHIIEYQVSGSSSQDINGTRQITKPEYAIEPITKVYDWCSNCGKTYDEKPWIMLWLKNRQMKFNSYFIRCGCCYTGCCCEEYGYCVKCCMYSWSVLISDDNRTWTEVHRVDKDSDMRRCNERSYKLEKEYTARYVKIVQTQPCPGYPPCLAINRFDLLGSIIKDGESMEDAIIFHDDDEDVSIIGHISRNGNNM